MSAIDVEPRPLPPPLVAVLPDCSLCGETVDTDTDWFICRPCGATWRMAAFHEDGAWEDDEEHGQCVSAIGGADRRCVLTDGHEREHRSTDGSSWPGKPYKVWAYRTVPGGYETPASDESGARYFARILKGEAVWRMSDKPRTWVVASDD